MKIHEKFKQICNLIKKQINDSLEKYDLTFSQSNILMFILLNKDKKINQRQIEHEFNLSNPTVNGILNRLENKRFIKRSIDEKDKRIKYIIPLQKSYEFMENVKKTKEKMEINMLKNINEEELATLDIILEKININLKEEIK